MPYIGQILEQVAPFMEKMFITLSRKSTDGTTQVVADFARTHPNVELDYEDVEDIGELTDVLNSHVRKCKSDWLLRLDDDDYWTTDQFQLCLGELEKDPGVMCYAIKPYQLFDEETHDTGWHKKYFSKFMRKTSSLCAIQPFPRDLPADKDGPLYWKWHKGVRILPYYFFHLSYLKTGSLRNEEWAKVFAHQFGKPTPLPEDIKHNVPKL